MPKPDAAHLQTDKELAKLEKRIAKIYKEAADDLQSTIDDYFAKFAKRDAKQKARLEAGEITEQEYKQWRLAQMGRGERFKALQSRVSERYTEANETAVRYVNDATPGIYSLNRNYSAYTIEKVAGNIGFDLWDERTVRRLIVDNPEVMPYYPPEKALKRGIDLAYGKKQISASVTSSILQGKSIPGIAKDLQTRIPDMNKASAIRTARTAVTNAQNAGRMDSYVAATKMGIEMEREWVSALDARTRPEHAEADGKVVGIDEPFIVGGEKLMFPGDRNGSGWNIYNCRCTQIAKVKGVDTSDAKRRARDPETGESVLIENMSYSEWAKKTKENIAEKTNQSAFVGEKKVNESKTIKLEQPELKESWMQRYEEGKRLSEKYKDYSYDSAFRAAMDSDYDIVAGMIEDIEEWGPKTQFIREQFFKAGFYGDVPEYVSAVRYGEIPESGRSKNWAEGTLEQGVSVIGIVRKENDFEMKSMYDVTLGMQDIKKYEVRGWFLGRTGSDGEPLLLMPKIEREL